jgi:hypothetical protein
MMDRSGSIGRRQSIACHAAWVEILERLNIDAVPRQDSAR